MKDLFTATPAEREIIERIAKRAVALYRKYGNTDAMTDPIYCYYHRHAHLEIIQRHGQTYAVCPECRRIMTEGIRSELNRANHGNHLSSDDLVHKLINRAEPVNPIPPVYIYIDQP